MTENIEQLLDNQATLMIYMVKQGEQWVRHSGGLIEKMKPLVLFVLVMIGNL